MTLSIFSHDCLVFLFLSCPSQSDRSSQGSIISARMEGKVESCGSTHLIQGTSNKPGHSFGARGSQVWNGFLRYVMCELRNEERTVVSQETGPRGVRVRVPQREQPSQRHIC